MKQLIVFFVKDLNFYNDYKIEMAIVRRNRNKIVFCGKKHSYSLAQ